MTRNNKIAILALTIIMLVGTLTHSIVFYLMNICWPIVNGSMLVLEPEFFDARIGMRSFAETFNGVCLTIFFIGGMIVIYSFARNGSIVSLKKISLFFLSILFALLACTVPFAVIDHAFWVDYLFPLWSATGNLVTFFVIILLVNIGKHSRSIKQY